jgi:hypothetical protein
MAEHVISHRKPRRKRRGWWSFTLRRFGALRVTLAALITASWLAPRFYRPEPAPPQVAIAPAPASRPPSIEARQSILVAETDPSIAPAPRPRRARRGVPLDAHPGAQGEDFEILSAGELDAISQAGN